MHSRRGAIYRLKPRYNADVNGYWMCDHGRTTFEQNAAPDRLQSSLVRESERFLELEAPAVARRAARALENANRVGIVVSAGVTVEEAELLARILDKLGGGPKILVSPETSEIADDGKLISTDRFPNRRGLEAVGFAKLANDTPPADVDALIIVRADVAALGDAWKTLLEGLSTTVVLDERVTDTLGNADQVLAVASHFESAGTFVNRDGRAQRFEKAIDPPGTAVAGETALGDLLAALGGAALESEGRGLTAGNVPA